MSQADPIVARVETVRRRDALNHTLLLAGWMLLVWAGVLVGLLVIERVGAFRIPALVPGAGGTAAGLLVLAGVMGWRRRASSIAAATSIDEKLLLGERLSTALQLRGLDPDRYDAPMVQKIVREASDSAAKADLRGLFPVRVPRTFAYAGGALALAAVIGQFVPDWVRESKPQMPVAQTSPTEVQQAKQTLADVIAAIEQSPSEVADHESIRDLRRELEEAAIKPIDPAEANRLAARAASELDDMLKEQVERSREAARARQDQRTLARMEPTPEDEGPVADLRRAMAQNDFETARQKLDNLAESELSEADRAEAERQMQDLEKQLAEAAQDDRLDQQVQSEMSQMGLTQEQIQQMTELAQRAAQGDEQAQQQLQQMMQQASDALSDNPEAQKQLENLVNQLQSQQQARDAAEQMRQAMEQMRCSSPNSQAQQQAAQQMADMLAKMGQNQQKMASAKKAREKAKKAGQGGSTEPGEGHIPNDDFDPFNAEDFAQGNNLDPLAMAGQKTAGMDGDRGRSVASSFVRAGTLVGESSAELREAVRSNAQQASDVVDRQRVARPAQKAIRDYFASIAPEEPAKEPKPAP